MRKSVFFAYGAAMIRGDETRRLLDYLADAGGSRVELEGCCGDFSSEAVTDARDNGLLTITAGNWHDVMETLALTKDGWVAIGRQSPPLLHRLLTWIGAPLHWDGRVERAATTVRPVRSVDQR